MRRLISLAMCGLAIVGGLYVWRHYGGRIETYTTKADLTIRSSPLVGDIASLEAFVRSPTNGSASVSTAVAAAAPAEKRAVALCSFVAAMTLPAGNARPKQVAVAACDRLSAELPRIQQAWPAAKGSYLSVVQNDAQALAQALANIGSA
ncbi:MAG: hypothetical protein ACYDGN_12310 [Acidimicrobiales bacterium]